MADLATVKLATSYAEPLRYLRGGLDYAANLRELARLHGKVPSNLVRDFASLVAAGVLTDDGHTLTPEGARILAGLDVAEGLAAVPPEGTGAALHHEIAPHPLNPRKHFDPDALDALREDIVQRGYVMQNLVLRPADPERLSEAERSNGVRFWIVAGERRWRAVGLAIDEDDWPEDRRLPYLLREMDDREHLTLAVAENLQRADLDHLELGEAFAAMIEAGMTPVEVADEVKRTHEHVLQHLRILQLPDADKARLRLPKGDDDRLTFHAAVKLVARPRDLSAQAGLGLDTGRVGSGGGADERGPRENSREAVEGATPLKAWEPAPDTFAPSRRQGLILAELARKAAADAVSFTRAGYTAIAEQPADRETAELVMQGAVGIRFTAALGLLEARIVPGGAGDAWLSEKAALFADYEEFLGHVRMTCGEDPEADRYATAWLNPPDQELAPAAPPHSAAAEGEARGAARPGPPPAAPDPMAPGIGVRIIAQDEYDAAPLRSPAPAGEPPHDYLADDPDQPALLEPDAAEAERITAARAAQAQREADEAAIAALADALSERAPRLAPALKAMLGADPAPAALARQFQAYASAGDATAAGYCLARLVRKAGVVGAGNRIAEAAWGDDGGEDGDDADGANP